MPKSDVKLSKQTSQASKEKLSAGYKRKQSVTFYDELMSKDKIMGSDKVKLQKRHSTGRTDNDEDFGSSSETSSMYEQLSKSPTDSQPLEFPSQLQMAVQKPRVIQKSTTVDMS